MLLRSRESKTALWPSPRKPTVSIGGVSRAKQHLMIAAALAHPVSRQWKGYWQRNISA
jgi:hypothetical protein